MSKVFTINGNKYVCKMIPRKADKPMLCKRRLNHFTIIYFLKHLTQFVPNHNEENQKYSLKVIDSFQENDLRIVTNDIIKNCNKNILIYTKSEDNVNMGKHIATLLSMLPRQVTFNNVNVIHETSSIKNLVYEVLADDGFPLVRKVTNVFIGEDNIRKHFKLPDSLINKTFVYKKNQKTYKFRCLENNTVDEQELEQQWWFLWYFSVPPCASGRMIQISGTCWFNATFNIMLLTPSIAKMMIQSYYQWKKSLNHDEATQFETNATFASCLTMDKPLKYLLYTIIYLILIKGRRMSDHKTNISAELAARVKSLYKTQKEEEFLNLKKINADDRNMYSKGGYPNLTIILLLKTLFHKSSYMIVFEKETNYLEKYRSGDSYKVTSDALMKNTMISNINTDIPEIILIMFSIASNRMHALKQLVIDNITYKLTSACIIVNDATHGVHVIAGLTCENTWYIYDSNNIIHNCEWYDLNHCQGYIINRNKNFKYNYNFTGFSYHIYSKV